MKHSSCTQHCLLPAVLQVLLLCASLDLARSAPATFYVSHLNGNNQWSGSLATPNSEKNDGPFATPERALQVARQWNKRAGNTASGSLTIFITGGVYQLKQSLVLSPADSGLVLAALPNRKPVLSGGRRITGWKKVEREGKQFWAAEVPQVRDGNWVFRELWVNGHRAGRRHPNVGYLKVAGVVAPVGIRHKASQSSVTIPAT